MCTSWVALTSTQTSWWQTILKLTVVRYFSWLPRLQTIYILEGTIFEKWGHLAALTLWPLYMKRFAPFTDKFSSRHRNLGKKSMA